GGARGGITGGGGSGAEGAGVAGGEADVVPGGVGGRFTPAADAARARRALGLAGPYVLCVAGESERKNFAALAAVASALAPRGVSVVTAGSRRAHHGAPSSPAGVRALGYVDDALLPGLYAGAEAFVLPSRHEGFGLTCLEAMACGT